MKSAQIHETKYRLFEKLAKIAASFGSPARLKILHVLAQAPRSVEAIAEITGESTANTSQHLQKLLSEGLVLAQKDKLLRIYRLSDPTIALLLDALFDLGERISPSLIQIEMGLVDTEIGKPVELASIHSEIKKQSAVMLDVRDEYETAQTPIQSAIAFPLEVLREKAKSLPRDKVYYVVCRGRACELATEGVKILRSLGLKAYRLKESPASIRHKTEFDVA